MNSCLMIVRDEGVKEKAFHQTFRYLYLICKVINPPPSCFSSFWQVMLREGGNGLYQTPYYCVDLKYLETVCNA